MIEVGYRLPSSKAQRFAERHTVCGTRIRSAFFTVEYRGRERLPSVFKPVADSTQCLQIARMPRIAFDFLPQPSHENIDGTWRHERAFFPHCIKQLVARKDASAVPCQVFQQPELADGREYGFALHPHRHRSDIDLQVSELNHLMAGSLGLNAQNVADARNQLARAERLGNVPIAPRIERLQAVGFLRSSRQKNYGSLAQLLVLANLAAEVEAANPRQHDVEQKQRRLRPRRLRDDRRA